MAGTDIIDRDGEKVILKGAGLGGHMNMENSITGYPGHEHEHRKAMLKVLGPEKYKFFFDRFLDYFFTDADAEFFASLGLNCIRVPFNYRHFEDDMDPRRCAKCNLYVILDLHSAPGGQNQDWHSDSGINKAFFWEFKDFLDRAIDLWVELAKRYRGNPFIAGYNPPNEPADPEHTRLVDLPLPNCVYACHDYAIMGFPVPEQYEGTAEQKAELRSQFDRKAAYMKERNVPIWNGEWGPVYEDPLKTGKEAAETINAKRFALLKEQLNIYRDSAASWSIWLYKDIGYQGMVYLDPESPYMKLVEPFLQKKAKYALDFWCWQDSGVKHIYGPFIAALEEMVPETYRKRHYPNIWPFAQHITRAVRNCVLSEFLSDEFAELFANKTEEELEAIASSFRLENCIMRDALNDDLKEDAALSTAK
ncbi:putative Glycoside hydrolase family 5 protein [Seiridium cardinale]|uniref:Glycoside hydrolase family 5 protein n=1 Tax=Seiridium cardinale TaxID=138064 RepID=A0ABR2X6I9_9PEZI